MHLIHPGVLKIGLPILAVYVSVQMLELVKCVIGGILVKKGVWINDITAYSKA